MQAGDKLYYLYRDKFGKQVKYPAILLAFEDQQALIRVGRFDILSQNFITFESAVAADLLSPRSVPCSFESELETGDS